MENEAPTSDLTGPGQAIDNETLPDVPVTIPDRLNQLERQMITLRREMRSVQVEWEDYFERFRNLLSRLTKRDKRAADNGAADPVPINPAAAALLNSSRNRGG